MPVRCLPSSAIRNAQTLGENCAEKCMPSLKTDIPGTVRGLPSGQIAPCRSATGTWLAAAHRRMNAFTLAAESSSRSAAGSFCRTVSTN